MRLFERLLAALSRDPREDDYLTPGRHHELGSALDLLRGVYPDFLGMIRDRRVLDFGCGTGHQAVAMALEGARGVVGVDTNPATLAEARALAEAHGVTDRVRFIAGIGEDDRDAFDLVTSQNSMEHFPDPAAALAEMASALHAEGRLLVTFGPPWFAPYGSHTHFFTRVPWVNLLFPEPAVMAVRARFRSDGATRYEEVESGLNRMTLAKFERLVREGGLVCLWRRYDGVKGMHLATRVPVLREILTNHVSSVLAPAPGRRGHRRAARTAGAGLA